MIYDEPAAAITYIIFTMLVILLANYKKKK